MIAFLAITLAIAGAGEQPQGIFAGKPGDKLLVCAMRASESGGAAASVRLVVFLPTYKLGDLGYKAGRERIDTLSIAFFDPSRVMKGLKANVLVDRPDRFAVMAGAVLDKEPVVLAINPEMPVGLGFTAVVGSQQGSIHWLGSCAARTGSGVRAEFEALK